MKKWIEGVKKVFLGKKKSPLDKQVFHSLSLIAFFAWVGLGADGLSSSCYGPEEAFLALGGRSYLGVFVALASAFTVILISLSYSQIIELFPSGGGGYVVASKLISPGVGMFSGCALIIDYVLTITISIASGTDALFSFLPLDWHFAKLGFAIVGVLLLTLLNMRGVKESVVPLVPVFLVFLISHVGVILYVLITNLSNFPGMLEATVLQVRQSQMEVGSFGLLFLLFRAFSMGAGTFTGIEAVSNGLPILREPRVETGKRTMHYMALSLSFLVLGLMLSYLIVNVRPEAGKTLNAVLLENIALPFGNAGSMFVLIALVSEAMLLLIAAQAGFLDGPRVLASMAIDRWFPTKFSSLSDRLVVQNGVLLMGGAATAMMLLTGGSVRFLVVLYSINVFITFSLSQLGMIRHWWAFRKEEKRWFRKFFVNGSGFLVTTVILISVIIIKFHEGGWVTLVFTLCLSGLALLIQRHYRDVAKFFKRLDNLIQIAKEAQPPKNPPEFDPKAKTAVLFVNGFTGVGLYLLKETFRLFGNECKNFVFVEVGVVDAGNFKGIQEVGSLQEQCEKDVEKYADFMRSRGYYAEGISFVGIDVMAEIEKFVPSLLERFQNAVFLAGQLVLPKENFFTRMLHNHTVFSLQRLFYRHGSACIILPIRAAIVAK